MITSQSTTDSRNKVNQKQRMIQRAILKRSSAVKTLKTKTLKTLTTTHNNHLMTLNLTRKVNSQAKMEGTKVLCRQATRSTHLKRMSLQAKMEVMKALCHQVMTLSHPTMRVNSKLHWEETKVPYHQVMISSQRTKTKRTMILYPSQTI